MQGLGDLPGHGQPYDERVDPIDFDQLLNGGFRFVWARYLFDRKLVLLLRVLRVFLCQLNRFQKRLPQETCWSLRRHDSPDLGYDVLLFHVTCQDQQDKHGR